jgi:hypothetical protein
MEEPAELIEKLASSDIALIARGAPAQAVVAALNEQLPGEVAESDAAREGQFAVAIERSAPTRAPLFKQIPHDARHIGNKGILLLEEDRLRVCGATEQALEHALTLLMRFADLARVEAAANS